MNPPKRVEVAAVRVARETVVTESGTLPAWISPAGEGVVTMLSDGSISLGSVFSDSMVRELRATESPLREADARVVAGRSTAGDVYFWIAKGVD